MVVVRSITTSILMAGEIEACNSGNKSPHPVDGADDVGAGLAEDDDQNCRLAGRKPQRANVFHRILHVGNIAEAHDGVSVLGNDQRAGIVRRR